jgi:predicted dehydrogenase
MARSYTTSLLSDDYREVLREASVDAVCIATQAGTHYTIAREALLAGKHVWVEKPMCLSLDEALDLGALAARSGRVLMVDHTHVYAPAVQRMKQALAAHELGELVYYDSVRVNLGRYYDDVNVIADLATHDFALLDYLLDETPCAVTAVADARPRGSEAFAYVTLHYDGPFVAHSHVSWLAPAKVRRVTLCGTKQMLVFDDLEAEDKLRFFDRGIVVPDRPLNGQREVVYRSGAIQSPVLDESEPLQLAAQHFATCIATGWTPLTDATAGARVVAMLEASQRSLRAGGRRQTIDYGGNER